MNPSLLMLLLLFWSQRDEEEEWCRHGAWLSEGLWVGVIGGQAGVPRPVFRDPSWPRSRRRWPAPLSPTPFSGPRLGPLRVNQEALWSSPPACPLGFGGGGGRKPEEAGQSRSSPRVPPPMRVGRARAWRTRTRAPCSDTSQRTA